MEKVLYALWKPAQVDAGAFCESLHNDVCPAVVEAGVRGLRLSLTDAAVSPAAGLKQEKICPAADAVLSIWLDSANDRAALEALFQPHCERFAGYLVTESEPLANDAPVGERMGGWTQVVFLERPTGMSEADWLAVWLGSHTGIAIETQSTFAYRQNVVTRVLTEGAPEIHAVVEESFPDAAMTSPHAFYDVESDEELKARVGTMIESCARFIDFERINVMPMSDYLLKAF